MSAHYDTEHCTVTYDAGKCTVILAWKKFAKGDDFKNALEAGLELVKKKGAKRWVGDCQNLGPIAPADQKWVNEDWFPRLLGTGMQRMAVIIPKSALSKMAVDQIMTKVEGTDFVSCNFGDFDEGASWVTERKAA